jgi:16S rRNA (cytidine1402-2'-O)-methyltransferase
MPLAVVPTPIGNLGDMTLRGLEVLREADVIACEDTRRTLKLLNRYEIKKPLIAYHEHNERECTEQLIKRLERGEKIALVSDAGTPGLSDPGVVLIRAAIERDLPFDVLPGANALLPALLISAIGMEQFYFAGFLKGKREEKRRALEELKEIKATLVFYMAPHRLLKELELMGEALGDREAVLVREISKIHQERIAATLLTFKDVMDEEKIKGEFVCAVKGADEGNAEPPDWETEAIALYNGGESVKNVANLLSLRYCIPRNRIKRLLLENCSGEEK